MRISLTPTIVPADSDALIHYQSRNIIGDAIMVSIMTLVRIVMTVMLLRNISDFVEERTRHARSR